MISREDDLYVNVCIRTYISTKVIQRRTLRFLKIRIALDELGLYRVPAVNLTLYIFGPASSHMYPTGQNEVPLEPQRPHEDFGVSHAQIKHS